MINSKRRSNTVSIWYFAVYVALYWRGWKGCHFLAHLVYNTEEKWLSVEYLYSYKNFKYFE